MSSNVGNPENGGASPVSVQQQEDDEVQEVVVSPSGTRGKTKRKRMKDRSEVWEHFVKKETPLGLRATCKYCNMEYKCNPKKNGTSVLWGHLNRCLDFRNPIIGLKMKKIPHDSEMPTSSKIKFEESEEESSSDDEEAAIKNALADVTFEELHKARSNGSFALYQKRGSENKSKRANKNRPMEVSCKKPVSRYREVIQAPKKVARDPRFESLCGTFDEEGFKKRYNFIYEENLPAEKEELKRSLKKSKDPKVIEDLTNRISLIDKQLKPSDTTKLRKNQILSEHKKMAREAAKQGKRPFYIKKSDIRERLQIEKYNKLKASGKLDSYIEKKRKRTAAKDHKFMPYRMANNDE